MSGVSEVHWHLVPVGMTDEAKAAEAISAPATDGLAERLWCLHILGPDDLEPAPSVGAALDAAIRFNETFSKISEDAGVLYRAVVAEWPGTAEEHAAQVGKFMHNWMTPPSAMRGAR